MFDLQQEITRNIAGALETELASGERERLEERPTEDLDAYRLYVEGRQRLAQAGFEDEEHIQEAVRLFRRAIERDSSFALAWSGLSYAVAVAPRLQRTRATRSEPGSTWTSSGPQMWDRESSRPPIVASV